MWFNREHDIYKGPNDTFVYIIHNKKDLMFHVSTRQHCIEKFFSYEQSVDFAYRYLYDTIPSRKKAILFEQELDKGFGSQCLKRSVTLTQSKEGGE